MSHPCLQCQKPKATKPGGYCPHCRDIVKRAGLIGAKRAYYPFDREAPPKGNNYIMKLDKQN